MNTGSAITFKVECLTPVHVGSGDELARRVDFHFVDGATEILDLERLLEILLAPGEGAPDRLVEQTERRIIELFQRPGFDITPYRLHRVAGDIKASRLRMAIRSADGRPLIPGSSIKGALRTLILAGWTGENGPHSKRPAEADRIIKDSVDRRGSQQFRAQSLENKIFRSHTRHGEKPDPKTDLLRMLALSDAAFAADSLEVLSTKALGTNTRTLTAVEALKAGAAAPLEVRLGDGFAALRLFSKELPPLGQIAEWSRIHAKFLLEGDHNDFFKRRSDGQKLADCLDALLAELRRAHEGDIFIRLGWGTGWRTMTGDILRADEKKRLGESDSRTARYVGIGKTRKVVLDGHSEQSTPARVLGWLKLTPISVQEAARLYRDTTPPAIEPPPAPPPVSPEPRPSLPDVDPFEQRLNALTARDLGRVQGEYDRAVGTPDPARRAHRLEVMAAKLIELWGRDKKRMRRFAATMPELAPHLGPGGEADD